jgi:hypothetical protein
MNFNKKTRQIIALAVVLIILTIGFAAWQDYLNEHFVGTFDQYGLPSQFFRTGWPLIIDAWPIWLIPSVLLVLIVQTIDRVLRHFIEAKRNTIAESNAEKTATITGGKEKNQIEFHRAIEIESLKQQVEILKHKYFEEHRKSQDATRNIEEAVLALHLAQKETAEAKAVAQAAVFAAPSPAKTTQAPSNAHNEAVITSLKADNKKLQKQIAELQEDLEQSNALIEKLLESQGN